MLSLETILDRGRQYLAQVEITRDVTRDRDWCDEVGRRALCSHSTAMRDLSLEDATALLAALVGAVKWHERQEPGSAYYLCAARDHLETAAGALADHWDEVEESCEDPPERLSGEQLGLRAC